MSDSRPIPTDAEFRILRVLWRHGPQTVRAVHERVADERDVGYTTTLKILQNMHQKGLAHRDDSRRSHVYEAALDRESALGGLLGDLTDRVFEGSTARLVLGALSSQPASKEELDEIRAYLDELEVES